MSTAQLFTGYKPGVRSREPTVSFELYPPRNPSKHSGIWAGVNKLLTAGPDFVSVTYSPAGSRADSRDRSVQLLLNVLDNFPRIPAVAHLTCLGYTPGSAAMVVRLLLRAGIRDFLALRGDPPAPGADFDVPEDGLRRGVELVELIRQIAQEELPDGVGTGPGGTDPTTAPNPDNYVSIGVAAYPATTGKDRSGDIAALAEKQAAGADYAITQIFYHPDDYASMVSECAQSGVRIPILPGILPLHDERRLRTMERLAGIPVPAHLDEIYRKYPPGEKRVDLTLKETVKLASACLEAGAPGLHFYTFNRPRPVLDILEYLRAFGYTTRGRPELPGEPEVDTDLVRLALHHLTPSPFH